MADIKREQERDELYRSIWKIADELRGAVDGWDFKQYVLGIMFYRYISENLKEEETRAFISDSFKNGFVKTTGTDIVKIMPATGRFGKNNNLNKKQNIL